MSDGELERVETGVVTTREAQEVEVHGSKVLASHEHGWPQWGHLFGPWQSEKGLPNATMYRTCVHPKCNATESRPAPKG